MKLHLWPKHYNHTQNRAKSVSYTSSPFSPYLGALELQFALGPFYTFVALSIMILYQLESIHLDDSNLIYSQNKNRGFTEIFTAFPLLYNMIFMPSIQILFFSNQFQCIIPQFHKSITNFNISYKIQHQTLTIHSPDFFETLTYSISFSISIKSIIIHPQIPQFYHPYKKIKALDMKNIKIQLSHH